MSGGQWVHFMIIGSVEGAGHWDLCRREFGDL